ncbi:hypothetical protein CVU37_03040 [candidate division BRC1 bacterium HGW-BRC1-1]|jgi:hypothetical protein|nr:MAG: hypothetical protein CVU37_03040 [candidate division BRC1 bacterium HGW-BRC1-1]
MSPRRDPYFGRFVFSVSVVGIIAIVLGLAGMWYYFQGGGARPAVTGEAGSLTAGAALNRLPPNKAMLYYTKDGKSLTGSIAEIGPPGTSPGDRAQIIIKHLIAGDERAFLKTPIPAGTKVNAVFVNDRMVIVDLSREYMNNLRGGVEAEMLAVFSVVNSLLYNIDNVDSVQIVIDNATVPTLNGNVDISLPLIANAALTQTN